jgi:hypothetical protein
MKRMRKRRTLLVLLPEARVARWEQEHGGQTLTTMMTQMA